MAGPYNSFPQHFSLLPPYYDLGENRHPVMGAAAYVRTGGLQTYQTQSAENLNTGFMDFEEANRPMLAAQKLRSRSPQSRIQRRACQVSEDKKRVLHLSKPSCQGISHPPLRPLKSSTANLK